jgi:predicted RNA-binding protein with PIN domain
MSDDAAAAVVRGLGAYLRATKPEELPGHLRRYKGYTPRGLQAHRNELVAALDDPALRARVLRWLDVERPRLPRDVAGKLKLACERPQGWEAELGRAGTVPVPTAPPPTANLSERVEREKERARRAREEARRVKQDAQVEVDAARARAAAVEEKLKGLAANLAASERRAVQLDKEMDRLRRELERERRKSRVAAERARMEKERIRQELAAAQREISRLLPKTAEVKRTSPRPKTPARPKPVPRGPRKLLPAPKGRLEDDPETLDEWLSSPRVHLLVDGYNVTKAEGGFAGALADQRSRLIDELARLVRKKRARATIVFDGSDVPLGLSRRRRGPVAVEYSSPHETADDHLISLLAALPPDPVIVATNDRELQERAAALGATIARANQLLALLR